ncbi:hypothetical protein CWC46_14895 [Prodigiosinella confusarubida]|uniref:Uncharacterized protein n=1 Tax=Serratia sp. (strain ATCC 39006) TaxID=104623 RepID=A0A2I5T8U9_SERS3|nr:hypothetical protein CWC46_14895 [Serratia sp. ATCC 39006]AUH05308.1 hypothetical protein Ser39006_014900 [Serratia sp. ATCC 39006]
MAGSSENQNCHYNALSHHNRGRPLYIQHYLTLSQIKEVLRREGQRTDLAGNKVGRTHGHFCVDKQMASCADTIIHIIFMD